MTRTPMILSCPKSPEYARRIPSSTRRRLPNGQRSTLCSVHCFLTNTPAKRRTKTLSYSERHHTHTDASSASSSRHDTYPSVPSPPSNQARAPPSTDLRNTRRCRPRDADRSCTESPSRTPPPTPHSLPPRSPSRGASPTPNTRDPCPG